MRQILSTIISTANVAHGACFFTSRLLGNRTKLISAYPPEPNLLKVET